MDVKNKRLSDGEFEALRKEVLAQCPILSLSGSGLRKLN
jgi:hypothetical protein